MSRDRLTSDGREAVVSRQAGGERQLLCLLDEGAQARGVLLRAGPGELPVGRPVAVTGLEQALEVLTAGERTAEDARRQVARLAFCHALGLRIGRPGSGRAGHMREWQEFLSGGDGDEEEEEQEDEPVVEVDEDELARGWGTLASSGTWGGVRYAVPQKYFWEEHLRLGEPLGVLESLETAGRLAGQDPAAAEMVAAAGMLDMEQARAALKAVARPDRVAVEYYGERAEAAADRRQAAEAYPLFAGLIARSVTLRRAIDERVSLQQALQDITGLAPAALRRLAKVDMPPPDRPVFDAGAMEGEDALGVERQRVYSVSGRMDAEDAFRVLGKLDPAWSPADRQEWEAFTTVLASGALPLSMVLDREPHELVRTARGDWRSWLDTLARDADYDDGQGLDRRRLALSLSDALQGVYDLSQRVVIPLVLSSVVERGFPVPGESRHVLSSAFGASMQAVCGSAKNPLGALLAFSRVYVSRLGALSEALGDDAPDGEAGVAGYAPGTWPPLFRGEWEFGELAVVNMASRDVLAEEGRIVDHCIGGYHRRGERGESHFVSVRGPDGTRSSVQFSGDVEGGLRVVQHRAFRNRRPPEAHVRAVEAFTEAVGTGMVALTPGLAEWRRQAEQREMDRRETDHWGWLCEMDRPQRGVIPEIWEEWRGILGGAAARAEHPGVLYRNSQVRELVRMLSPAAAMAMEAEARDARAQQAARPEQNDIPALA